MKIRLAKHNLKLISRSFVISFLPNSTLMFISKSWVTLCLPNTKSVIYNPGWPIVNCPIYYWNQNQTQKQTLNWVTTVPRETSSIIMKIIIKIIIPAATLCLQKCARWRGWLKPAFLISTSGMPWLIKALIKTICFMQTKHHTPPRLRLRWPNHFNFRLLKSYVLNKFKSHRTLTQNVQFGSLHCQIYCVSIEKP